VPSQEAGSTSVQHPDSTKAGTSLLDALSPDQAGELTALLETVLAHLKSSESAS
jgi:hypothetical protein